MCDKNIHKPKGHQVFFFQAKMSKTALWLMRYHWSVKRRYCVMWQACLWSTMCLFLPFTWDEVAGVFVSLCWLKDMWWQAHPQTARSQRKVKIQYHAYYRGKRHGMLELQCCQQTSCVLPITIKSTPVVDLWAVSLSPSSVSNFHSLI